MVLINKTEAEIIRKKLPNAHIARTAKQKSERHHYYCEESIAAMKLLSEIRAAAQADR